jgi:glycosyltransferase involved in cell wall biosynthesis
MSAESPTVTVLEPDYRGHRFEYVRYILQRMSALNLRASVATSSMAARHESWAWLQEAEPDHEYLVFKNLSWEPMKHKLGPIVVNPLWIADSVREVIEHQRQRGTAGLLVPYWNNLDYALLVKPNLLRGTRSTGIAMRERFHHQACGVLSPHGRGEALQEKLFKYRLKQPGVVRVYSLDPLLERYAQEQWPKLADRVRGLAEVTERIDLLPKAEAQASFGFAAEDKVVLLYGGGGPRKGAAELLAALRRLPRGVKALAVGAVAKDAEESMTEEDKGRVTLVHGHVTGEVEAHALSAADAMWMGYRGHYGSSGVLHKAQQAGIPVLACPEGLIGYEAAKNGLGLVSDPGNAEATASALQDLVNRPRQPVATTSDPLEQFDPMIRDVTGPEIES